VSQDDTVFLDMATGQEFLRISYGNNVPLFSPGGNILAVTGTYFFDATDLLDPKSRTDPNALADLRNWAAVFLHAKTITVRSFDEKATYEALAQLRQFPRLS